MAAFILVLFLSAFLLFQVQPVIARMILPWYGGSSSVWSTCMLFFQVGLVIGYGYAHLLVTVLGNRRYLQVGVHLAFVAIAITNLPITPDPELKPIASGASPVIEILKLLGRTVGIPYVILAATGPLVQSWFSHLYPDRSPFRLYAVSNVGSLLALLSYPFFFEVHYPVSLQSSIWATGFVIFALLLGCSAFFFTRGQTRQRPTFSPTNSQTETGPILRPTVSHRLRWVSFSICSSILLISITNKLCEDVAVIPFLWVLPLSLYLLTFIIAFDHSRWYSRKFMVGAAGVTIGFMIIQMNGHYSHTRDWPILWQAATLCAALFFTCFVCHGEIVRLKPPPRFLTEFYLLVSLGGALGGVFVNLVAPTIFKGYWELHVGLILLAVLVTLQLFPALRELRQGQRSATQSAIRISGAVAWLAALVGMAYGLKRNFNLSRTEVIASSRGFFGVLKVSETQIPGSEKFRSLYHGKTIHGLQFSSPERRTMPTAYFHPRSGVGITFGLLDQRQITRAEPLQVGVLGLGIGTLAAYARPGDHFQFYEINPEVADFARSHFTFLEDCQGDVELVLGDGRISLERELKSGHHDDFDLLVIDAFSGHAPPIHLLTQEAFELYFNRLNEGGVLALNISNGEIDFSDPIRNQARRVGMKAYQVIHLPEGGFPSIWVLVTQNGAFARRLERSRRITPWARPEPKNVFWTDDFNSLLQAFR